jgi:hypothetical protein
MTVGEALAWLMVWSNAADTQGKRLLTEGASGPAARMNRQGDAILFAFAVRQVLRAAELVRDLCPPGVARDAIDDALRGFHAGLPDVKDVRDVMDHFDDYATGKGKLQAKMLQPATFTYWTERGPYTPITDGGVVNVRLTMAVGSRTMTVDVFATVSAVNRLHTAIDNALAADSGHRD